MDFKLSEDQQLMKKMFKEFTDQFIAPIAAELDEEERFPEEIIPIMGETGLFGIPISDQYGGAGAGNLSYVLAVEEISKADRKSTRLNSSHANISYAVFCLKKKKKRNN